MRIASLSNLVRLDVREALLRPDLRPIKDRKTFWYVRVPTALADGSIVPSSGSWKLARTQSLSPSGANDPLVRALLVMYARERHDIQRAYPEDPNFTGPLEATWTRLTMEAAEQRPFAGTHCLALDSTGALLKTSDDFAIEPINPSDLSTEGLGQAPSAVVATLAAYRANKATKSQVTRALVEHGSWFAPIRAFASGSPEPTTNVVLFPASTSTIPGVLLWLFSDEAHAKSADAWARAQGDQLGRYVGGVRGVDLFEKLPDLTFEKLEINVGSPESESYAIGARATPLLVLWAGAIRIEQLLRVSKTFDEPELVAAVRAYSYLCTFTSRSTGGFLRVDCSGKACVPICTAIDCLDAFEESLSDETRADVEQLIMPGAALFGALSDVVAEALVFNPVGPGVRREVPGSVVAAFAGE